jgi:hypothetical protein
MRAADARASADPTPTAEEHESLVPACWLYVVAAALEDHNLYFASARGVVSRTRQRRQRFLRSATLIQCSQFRWAERRELQCVRRPAGKVPGQLRRARAVAMLLAGVDGAASGVGKRELGRRPLDPRSFSSRPARPRRQRVFPGVSAVKRRLEMATNFCQSLSASVSIRRNWLLIDQQPIAVRPFSPHAEAEQPP